MNIVDCRERTHVATIVHLVGNRQYWCICQQHHQTDGLLTDTPIKPKPPNTLKTDDNTNWSEDGTSHPDPVVILQKGDSPHHPTKQRDREPRFIPCVLANKLAGTNKRREVDQLKSDIAVASNPVSERLMDGAPS